MSSRMKSAARAWWQRLTWPQAALAVAGMVGVGLLMQHVPIDDAKQWATLLGGLLASAAAAGSLLNGRDRPKADLPEAP